MTCPQAKDTCRANLRPGLPPKGPWEQALQQGPTLAGRGVVSPGFSQGKAGYRTELWETFPTSYQAPGTPRNVFTYVLPQSSALTGGARHPFWKRRANNLERFKDLLRVPSRKSQTWVDSSPGAYVTSSPSTYTCLVAFTQHKTCNLAKIHPLFRSWDILSFGPHRRQAKYWLCHFGKSKVRTCRPKELGLPGFQTERFHHRHGLRGPGSPGP